MHPPGFEAGAEIGIEGEEDVGEQVRAQPRRARPCQEWIRGLCVVAGPRIHLQAARDTDMYVYVCVCDSRRMCLHTLHMHKITCNSAQNRQP